MKKWRKEIKTNLKIVIILIKVIEGLTIKLVLMGGGNYLKQRRQIEFCEQEF